MDEHRSSFWGAFVLLSTCVSPWKHLSRQCWVFARSFVVPICEQEAFDVVYEGLARFDGGTSWADIRAMSTRPRHATSFRCCWTDHSARLKHTRSRNPHSGRSSACRQTPGCTPSLGSFGWRVKSAQAAWRGCFPPTRT